MIKSRYCKNCGKETNKKIKQLCRTCYAKKIGHRTLGMTYTEYKRHYYETKIRPKMKGYVDLEKRRQEAGGVYDENFFNKP